MVEVSGALVLGGRPDLKSIEPRSGLCGLSVSGRKLDIGGVAQIICNSAKLYIAVAEKQKKTLSLGFRRRNSAELTKVKH